MTVHPSLSELCSTTRMTETQQPVVLGNKYRDTITGYEGTATARYTYLTGCERIELMRADKDGKPEGFVFDETTLEELDGTKPLVSDKPGGPRDAPERPSAPSR